MPGYRKTRLNDMVFQVIVNELSDIQGESKKCTQLERFFKKKVFVHAQNYNGMKTN